MPAENIKLYFSCVFKWLGSVAFVFFVLIWSAPTSQAFTGEYNVENIGYSQGTSGAGAGATYITYCTAGKQVVDPNTNTDYVQGCSSANCGTVSITGGVATAGTMRCSNYDPTIPVSPTPTDDGAYNVNSTTLDFYGTPSDSGGSGLAECYAQIDVNDTDGASLALGTTAVGTDGDHTWSGAYDNTYYYRYYCTDVSGRSSAWTAWTDGIKTICSGSATISWTDATITAGSTAIRKVHIDELRTWIDDRRVDADLSNYTWTDTTITAGSTAIRKTHIDEMRTAIEEVYTRCLQAVPTWTDPTLTSGSTAIRKVHIDELRSATSSVP